MSIVLKSASFAAGGDAQRDRDTKAAIEDAGFELPEESLPPLPALDQNGAPTPQEQSKNIEDYGRQVALAKAKYGDWDEKVNREIVIGTGTQLACLEAENGAEVIYYLATHEREAERIGKMSPVRQAAEVGRLSAQLPKSQRVARPVRPPDDATSAEIAQMRDYPNKYRDLKAAWRARR